MTIDFINFTPFFSLIGGIFIGIAALLMMVSKGRIMGVSGILSGLITMERKADWMWRISFIIGTIFGPFLLIFLFAKPIEYQAVSGGIIFWVAGVLVGIGSALGSGCTSGHGICGLARFSKRSFFAVAIFMATAISTVFIMQLIKGV
jgi:uncharacterized membrane protein YedE/YeeE